MSKEELLAILAQAKGDPERDHPRAEKALLEYVNDPEITAAWDDAEDEQTWWYA